MLATVRVRELFKRAKVKNVQFIQLDGFVFDDYPSR
jgi:hypothetical protein